MSRPSYEPLEQDERAEAPLMPRSRSASPTPQRQSKRRSRHWSPLYYVGLSIFTGVVLHVIAGAFPLVQEQKTSPNVVSQECPSTGQGKSLSELDLYDDAYRMSISEIEQMVSKTKGYFVRDWSLGLGWNNMRYIIEAAVAQATMLNRTLVLPSFVYARACEWENDSCSAFAVNASRKDAFAAGWSDLPMGWRVPMSTMLDLPRLRQSHSVIAVEDFLRYHRLNTSLEASSGIWQSKDYLPPGTSLFHLKQAQYDPQPYALVDDKSVILQKMAELKIPPAAGSGPIYDTLLASLGKDFPNNIALEWVTAVDFVKEKVTNPNNVVEVEEFLLRHQWATVHTFKAIGGIHWLKSPVTPIRQVVPVPRVMGFRDAYEHVSAKVFYLEGEIHLGRKPGFMRYTSKKGLQVLQQTILHDMHPIPKVRELAAVVHDRMVKRAGGRMWMAGHMRRGDFAKVGWAMEADFKAHFARIKRHLDEGRKILGTIASTKNATAHDIPGVKVDEQQLQLGAPLPGDPFYIGTDERSPEYLKYIREGGGLLIGDLVTYEDRRRFGWGIMLTDVLGLVEQAVMGRSYFFYAHAMSSVGGGAVNQRAARGADPRTSVID